MANHLLTWPNIQVGRGPARTQTMSHTKTNKRFHRVSVYTQSMDHVYTTQVNPFRVIQSQKRKLQAVLGPRGLVLSLKGPLNAAMCMTLLYFVACYTFGGLGVLALAVLKNCALGLTSPCDLSTQREPDLSGPVFLVGNRTREMAATKQLDNMHMRFYVQMGHSSKEAIFNPLNGDKTRPASKDPKKGPQC